MENFNAFLNLNTLKTVSNKELPLNSPAGRRRQPHRSQSRNFSNNNVPKASISLNYWPDRRPLHRLQLRRPRQPQPPYDQPSREYVAMNAISPELSRSLTEWNGVPSFSITTLTNGRILLTKWKHRSVALYYITSVEILYQSLIPMNKFHSKSAPTHTFLWPITLHIYNAFKGSQYNICDHHHSLTLYRQNTLYFRAMCKAPKWKCVNDLPPTKLKKQTEMKWKSTRNLTMLNCPKIPVHYRHSALPVGLRNIKKFMT